MPWGSRLGSGACLKPRPLLLSHPPPGAVALLQHSHRDPLSHLHQGCIGKKEVGDQEGAVSQDPRPGDLGGGLLLPASRPPGSPFPQPP